MIAVPICETSIILDSKEVCIGAICMKYESDEQFKVVHGLVMAIAKVCEMKKMNEMMMEALAKSKAYREGL
jgi:hypothetical protein